MQFKIHLLINPQFLGDHNQALGIKTALEKQYGFKIIKIKEWNDSEDEALTSLNDELKSDTQSQNILICIGEHGLQALQKIKRHSNTKMLSIYASHQIFPNLKVTTDKIDILALPTHVIDAQFLQDISKPHLRLVQTVGVAHNFDGTELDKFYCAWQREFQPIQSSDHYIGVILGGDAPEPDGTMRYFTAKEAKALGTFLAKLSQENNNPFLLITNSPRTGKYNPESKEVQTVHMGGALDETSKALLEELKSHDIKNQFFDFIGGKPSAYKPILRALQKQNSIAVVTGDSTSMISEMGDLLASKPLYIVNVGSMNDAHKAHVHSVNQAGYAHLVNLNIDRNENQCMPPAKITNFSDGRKTAAESIAAEVSHYYLAQKAQQVNTFELRTRHAPIAGLLFYHEKQIINEGQQHFRNKFT